MTTEIQPAQNAQQELPQDRHSGQQDVPLRPAAPADARNGETVSQEASVTQAEPATGAEDQKPETQQETPEKEAERQQSRRQRRYQKERDLRVAAETERDLLRKQLATQPPAQPAEKQPPKREDYQSYEDYLDARQDFRDDERRSKDAPQPQRSETQTQQQPTEPDAPPEKVVQEWGKHEAAFMKTAKDYKEVAGEFLDNTTLHGLAKQAIAEAGEMGPKILYHLGSNTEEAERIEKLSPARQAAEIVKLEEKLAKPVVRTESGAPRPVTPTRHNGSATPGFRDDMGDDEYRALRRSQGARWAQ